MADKSELLIEDLIKRYPVLGSSRSSIFSAAGILIETIRSEGKILTCGNGGSSADADHIVGELMKGFIKRRPLPASRKKALIKTAGSYGEKIAETLQQGIPAVSLSSQTALNTAFINDVDPEMFFAQQVAALGNPGDLLWCLSTSGNSANVAAAAVTGKAFGLKTLALTGRNPSRLSEICDICINVDETETYKIQELHLPVYHTLCMIIEENFFSV